MKYELLHHKIAYLVLTLGLVIATLTFLAVWPDKTLQRIVIVALVVFYFLWGTITHLHTTTLTKRVVYEYAAISLLAGTLLLLITL